MKINIKLDGKDLAVEPGTSVIAAADQVGVLIPRFCYHKSLSVAANCRMCLVEVSSMGGKVMPACATPVAEGMEINTKSPATRAAQQAVMEFLLINHPLDCPICDQGGECELQDTSFIFGRSQSRFQEGKRAVVNPDLGPLIATEMTRCIQCTRCVRFSEEIAGGMELGAIGRGEDLAITPYLERTVTSELSGNMLDICPVGALTSKPYRYNLRTWELNSGHTITPHDGWGTSLNLNHAKNKICRVLPEERIDLEPNWISDRDRFSYAGIDHPDRILRPKIKCDNVWLDVDWQQALQFCTSALQNIKKDNLSILLSPNCTLEEACLAQSFGSDLIDYRINQQDFSVSNLIKYLFKNYNEIDNAKNIILIGCALEQELPLAAVHVRNAIKNGSKVYAVNPYYINYKFAVEQTVSSLQDIISVLPDIGDSLMIIGNLIITSPVYGDILKALQNNQVRILAPGSNSVGLSKLITKPTGIDKIIVKKPESFIFHGFEPDIDLQLWSKIRPIIKNAKFNIAISSFVSDNLAQICDVILPLATLGENAGTIVNLCGKQQSFRTILEPPGQAKIGEHIWQDLIAAGGLI